MRSFRNAVIRRRLCEYFHLGSSKKARDHARQPAIANALFDVFEQDDEAADPNNYLEEKKPEGICGGFEVF